MHDFCIIGDNWHSETTMKKTGDKMQILSWETRLALESMGRVVLQTWKQAVAPLEVFFNVYCDQGSWSKVKDSQDFFW